MPLPLVYIVMINKCHLCSQGAENDQVKEDLAMQNHKTCLILKHISTP